MSILSEARPSRRVLEIVTTPIPIPEPRTNLTSRLLALMTPERWVAVGRIALTGLIALLYWRQPVPVPVLWFAVAMAARLWPRSATDQVRHAYDDVPAYHPYLVWHAKTGDRVHAFVIDDLHTRWPAR